MISRENINNPDFLKSSYLYGLTKVVHWPPNAFNFSISPFIIGIFGNTVITNTLINILSDKKIHDREWKVNQYQSAERPEYSHLVFLTGIELSVAKSFIDAVFFKEILLIGDNINGFCQAGGMINLVGSFPNFGYEINMNSIKKAKLNINPDFLELATLIDF